jgi:hypothetical protein
MLRFFEVFGRNIFVGSDFLGISARSDLAGLAAQSLNLAVDRAVALAASLFRYG